MDYIQHICDAGGEVYIVGGAVRNYLYNHFHGTNIPIKDYDYLVRLLDQQTLIRTLKKIGCVKEVGQSFGIVLFTLPELAESIEFALPRTETSTGTGYRDFIVTADHTMSIDEDFSRRDATINAIAIKVSSLNDLKMLNINQSYDFDVTKFIDPFGGITDIKNKVWRCVGDPTKRFVEDPTRIMRAFRQSTELNLTIEPATLSAISNDYSLMKSLIPQSYVRLFNEFLRMVKLSTYVDKQKENLKMLYDFGILDFFGFSNPNLQFDSDLPTVVKFCILISIDKLETSIKSWGDLRQICATNYLTPTDMNTLISVQKFYFDVATIDSKYKTLKVIEQIYKLYKLQCYQILDTIVLYLVSVGTIDKIKADEIKEYQQQAMTYPPSTDQLVLNGNILISKYKLVGQQIKTTKEKLLDLIFKDELTNELTTLELYIEKNDIQTS